MQVISAYLVKQIVDVVTPETTIRYELQGQQEGGSPLTVTVTQYTVVGESETSEVLAILTWTNEDNEDWWDSDYISLFTRHSDYGIREWGYVLKKENVVGSEVGTRRTVAGAVSLPTSVNELTFEA